MSEAVLSPQMEAIRKESEVRHQASMRRLEILKQAIDDNSEVVLAEPPTPESMRKTAVIGVTVGSQMFQESLMGPDNSFYGVAMDKGVPMGVRFQLLEGVRAGFQMSKFGEALGIEFSVAEVKA